jgi:hypothetical protein
MIEPQFVMRFRSACMRSLYMITQVGLKWLVWSDGWNIFGAQFVVAWVEEQPSSQSCPYDNKCLLRIYQFWGLSYGFGNWANAFLYAHPICTPFTLYQELLETQIWNIQACGSNCVKNDCRVWAGLTNASMPLILSHWLFFILVQVMEAMRKVYKKQ